MSTEAENVSLLPRKTAEPDTENRGRNPNSRKNLRPPWTSQNCPIPKGTQAPEIYRQRGTWKNKRSLEWEINRVLRTNRGEELKKLALGIIKAAQKGNGPALVWLGERLWPLPKDTQASSGKIVYTGVRLELPDGTTVSMGTSEATPELPETTPEQPSETASEASEHAEPLSS